MFSQCLIKLSANLYLHIKSERGKSTLNGTSDLSICAYKQDGKMEVPAFRVDFLATAIVIYTDIFKKLIMTSDK